MNRIGIFTQCHRLLSILFFHYVVWVKDPVSILQILRIRCISELDCDDIVLRYRIDYHIKFSLLKINEHLVSINKVGLIGDSSIQYYVLAQQGNTVWINKYLR